MTADEHRAPPLPPAVARAVRERIAGVAPGASVFIAIALWLAAAGAALADGGLVRISQVVGPYTVTVFSAPTPLRAGMVDISVLVQARASGNPVLDAEVAVNLQAIDDPARVVRGAATHAAAINQLLYAAELELPAPGRWRGDVVIHAGGGEHTVTFEVDAAPPLPDAIVFWPYLAAPFAALALYALHQWLTLRSATAHRA